MGEVAQERMPQADSAPGSRGATNSGPWADWFRAARKNADERAEAPRGKRRRPEYWKYTDPGGLENLPASSAVLSEGQSAFEGVDRLGFEFDGGTLDRARSDPLRAGNAEIAELGDAAPIEDHWASRLYGTLEAGGQTPVPRPFAAANTASATSGLVIRACGAVGKPLEIRHSSGGAAAPALARHLIVIEEGAELTLLESGVPGPGFNMVMEVLVKAGGSFRHVRVQDGDWRSRGITHMFARLEADASMKSFTATTASEWMRNEFFVDLAGENATAHLSGAAIGGRSFHQDDTLFVIHGAPNCRSRQVFKKVLRDGAVGVFQGKILVRRPAQKTDGYQLSQALLLDESSQFLAKPELEIYADDVACSHGSTCGGIDEDALFYLRSRGIGRNEAQDMLASAFLAEAVSEIDDPQLAEAMLGRINAWMAKRS